MKLSRGAIAVYIALIFASGLVLGALGHRLYTVNTVDANSVRQRPEEWRKRYTEEMKSRLTLNGEQLTKLNTILDETRVDFTRARARMKPEMDAIRDKQVNKIRAILNDGQRVEYEKMREERERNMKKAGPGPGPG